MSGDVSANVSGGAEIQLWSALVAQLAAVSGKAALVSHSWQPWASITFRGTRHEVVLRFEGFEQVEAGERLIAALPDHEFTIPGHLVADALVTAVEHRFGIVETLEVTAVILMLEED
jgi:hypothetical protein